jgi:hypothetical protein
LHKFYDRFTVIASKASSARGPPGGGAADNMRRAGKLL